jgi:hypothetical protein
LRRTPRAQRLAEAGILSAPVVDATRGTPATDFLGFLDTSDVVTSLLKGALWVCGACRSTNQRAVSPCCTL